jgi:hypothetical protein
MMLFPISGSTGSVGATSYTMYVQARRVSSDDVLTISRTTWCCDITEVEK